MSETRTVAPTAPVPGSTMALTIAPIAFLLLWSTGYISARLGLPYTEPFTFLFVRYGIVLIILALIAAAMRAPWPSDWRQFGIIAGVGCLIHAMGLGGIFVAIDHGVPSSVSALIVGTQPLLTAIGAFLFLNERVTVTQWLGQALGIVGVSLVITRKLDLDVDGLIGIAACLVALGSMTAGTLLQKRYCADMDLRSGATVQYIGAAALCGILAMLFEPRVIVWHPEFVIALTSLIFVSSLGAATLLFFLIRRGAASRVAGLFYLVPSVSAVIEYFLFGETFGWIAMFGMGLAAVGVMMITRQK